ncbi:MAG: endonuclease/exonuclease/phosphatase family protein [Actinomycetota bacterium]
MPRVATYNIRHCRGLDGAIDIDRIARTIVATGAGFIALQEVDRNLPRSGNVDQPYLLSAATGLEFVFWPTLRRGGGEYGVAVAAADPLETKYHPLPGHYDEEARAAIVARWAGITIVAVHLAQQKPARGPQIAAVARLAAKLPWPVVVLGDLNAPRRELRPLIHAGFDPGPRVRSRPGRGRPQIDYVLTGPSLSTARLWTVPADGSDHLPIVAELAPAGT